MVHSLCSTVYASAHLKTRTILRHKECCLHSSACLATHEVPHHLPPACSAAADRAASTSLQKESISPSSAIWLKWSSTKPFMCLLHQPGHYSPVQWCMGHRELSRHNGACSAVLNAEYGGATTTCGPIPPKMDSRIAVAVGPV